ncbi:MAG: DUF2975 domain-containing protein [Pseudomonadota bacterium]
MMSLTRQTTRLALFLCHLTSAAMVGLVALVLFVFAVPDILLAQFPAPFQGVQPASQGVWLGLAGVAGATLGALFWILWQMRILFKLYARKEILTQRCAQTIARIGRGFLILMVLSILNTPVLTLLLSIGQENGSMSIALNGQHVGLALSGGLLWLIGQVMEEAARQADDLKAII